MNISKQEAAFIALHFINSHYDKDNMHETLEITKIIQKIININYKKDLSQSSFTFSRFVIHLRYFVLRQLHSESNKTGGSLLDIVAIRYPNDYACAQAIKRFLEKQYSWKMT